MPPTLLKQLKELEDGLAKIPAETFPSWEQVGQVFNGLLAAAQDAHPDDPAIKDVKPVGEQKFSNAIKQVSAPLCDTKAGSMLVVVKQLVLVAGGARGNTSLTP